MLLTLPIKKKFFFNDFFTLTRPITNFALLGAYLAGQINNLYLTERRRKIAPTPLLPLQIADLGHFGFLKGSGVYFRDRPWVI